MQRQCRERGQNLAELALVLPLLIILFLGIADLGRAFHAFIVVENAAREAARYGASWPGQLDEARNRAVQEASAAGIAIGAPRVSIVNEGARLVVRAEVDHLFGSITGWWDLTITGTAQMEVLEGVS
jgi:Flp pilus assembly protein TadG